MASRAPRRTGLDAWLHTIPPLRWKPWNMRRRTVVVVRVGYRNPIAAAIGGFFSLYRYFFLAGAVLFVGAIPFIVWLLELEAWLCAWVYYGGILGARWVYRHNIIGQTVRSITKPRPPAPAAAPGPYPAHPMAPLPPALDADPYDTDWPRTRS